MFRPTYLLCKSYGILKYFVIENPIKSNLENVRFIRHDNALFNFNMMHITRIRRCTWLPPQVGACLILVMPPSISLTYDINHDEVWHKGLQKLLVIWWNLPHVVITSDNGHWSDLAHGHPWLYFNHPNGPFWKVFPLLQWGHKRKFQVLVPVLGNLVWNRWLTVS